jgi:Tfp pilus assembly protein PilO
MMKKLFIPLLVMAVIGLGYCVYLESKTKNKEINRLIHAISVANIGVSLLNSVIE